VYDSGRIRLEVHALRLDYSQSRQVIHTKSRGFEVCEEQFVDSVYERGRGGI
jgi:hypothetical protein